MKHKINAHLFMIALIAVISTTLGVMFAYYEMFQTQVRNDLKKNLELLSSLGFFNTTFEDKTIASNLANSSFGADNLRITWIDSTGKVLFDSEMNATKLPIHLNRPEILDALSTGYGETVRVSSTFQMNTYYSALRLENGTVLRVSTQAWTISRVFLAVTPIIFVLVIAILILCILIGRTLTQMLINPIFKLIEELNEGVKSSVYPELIPLAEKIRNQHENILSSAKKQTDFTANVSHELKTPLTAISGYIELLENHMVDSELEDDIIRKIRQNITRLQSLINDVVRLSEFEHENLHRSFTTFDLFEVASECCSSLQIIGKKHNVSLSCSGTSAFLLAEKNLIRELINNLIQNSIQYNNDGGFVKIVISLDKERPVLTIKDNGIGVPLDEQDRIFERFYRVDKSRSRETGGTGLGLAIVKHIAELHRAHIHINSVFGKGTAIIIKF